MKYLLMFCFILFISCSHQKSYRISNEKINGTKEISIESENRGAPWLSELEMYLGKKGITVKRNSISGSRTDKSTDHDLTYNQSATRYILRVQGEVDYARRCFGGGFTFNYLTAELYDSLENKSIVNVTDSGYSEGCPPAFSNMFENVANEVALSWGK